MAKIGRDGKNRHGDVAQHRVESYVSGAFIWTLLAERSLEDASHIRSRSKKNRSRLRPIDYSRSEYRVASESPRASRRLLLRFRSVCRAREREHVGKRAS